MIQLQKPFTDQHGITHVAPVIVVSHINYSNNKQQSCTAKVEQGKVSYTPSQDFGSSNLHFQAVLYRDLAALEQGLDPIPLKSNAYITGFNINEVPSATMETYIAQCEQWLIDNVLSK